MAEKGIKFKLWNKCYQSKTTPYCWYFYSIKKSDIEDFIYIMTIDFINKLLMRGYTDYFTANKKQLNKIKQLLDDEKKK